MRRDRSSEEGFTLVEVMVVVLIIGMFVVIALPTFLGARVEASDRAAQVNLGNGLIAARIWFTDTKTYTSFDEVEGETIEPSLNWATLAAPHVGEVAVDAVSAADLHLVAFSATGTFFCLHDDVSVGTAFGSGATFDSVDDEVECGSSSW